MPSSFSCLPCAVQEQEEQEAPDGLIEKSGVDGLPVHGDGPGKIGRPSVSFRIEVVAPTSDGLGKGDGGSRQIQQVQGPDLPEITQERGGPEPGDQSSVDRQPAGPDVDDIKEVTRVPVPVEQDIIKTRAYDPGRDADDHEIEDLI